MITSHLKDMGKLLAGTHKGFTYKNIYSWSLWTAGAMALLYYGVGIDIISLVGRWRSEKC